MTVHAIMSRGPFDVRYTISGYLKKEMPKWIGLARTQWSLPSEDDLPNPDLTAIFEHERDAVDRYPQTIVGVSRGALGGRVDHDDVGAEDFRTLYTVRLYTHVRATGERETLRVRDDYSTVLRWCLTASKTMGNPNFEWLIETLSEDFSVGIKVGGDRWVGAVTHSFTCRMDEHNVQAPLGSADLVSISAGILQ